MHEVRLMWLRRNCLLLVCLPVQAVPLSSEEVAPDGAPSRTVLLPAVPAAPGPQHEHAGLCGSREAWEVGAVGSVEAGGASGEEAGVGSPPWGGGPRLRMEAQVPQGVDEQQAGEDVAAGGLDMATGVRMDRLAQHISRAEGPGTEEAGQGHERAGAGDAEHAAGAGGTEQGLDVDTAVADVLGSLQVATLGVLPAADQVRAAEAAVAGRQAGDMLELHAPLVLSPRVLSPQPVTPPPVPDEGEVLGAAAQVPPAPLVSHPTEDVALGSSRYVERGVGGPGAGISAAESTEAGGVGGCWDAVVMVPGLPPAAGATAATAAAVAGDVQQHAGAASLVGVDEGSESDWEEAVHLSLDTCLPALLGPVHAATVGMLPAAEQVQVLEGAWGIPLGQGPGGAHAEGHAAQPPSPALRGPSLSVGHAAAPTGAGSAENKRDAGQEGSCMQGPKPSGSPAAAVSDQSAAAPQSAAPHQAHSHELREARAHPLPDVELAASSGELDSSAGSEPEGDMGAAAAAPHPEQAGAVVAEVGQEAVGVSARGEAGGGSGSGRLPGRLLRSVLGRWRGRAQQRERGPAAGNTEGDLGPQAQPVQAPSGASREGSRGEAGSVAAAGAGAQGSSPAGRQAGAGFMHQASGPSALSAGGGVAAAENKALSREPPASPTHSSRSDLVSARSTGSSTVVRAGAGSAAGARGRKTSGQRVVVSKDKRR